MPPTDSVVELVDDRGARRHGRFPARPTSVDPLAARSLVPRALRRLRLKEWVGWTLLHPDWACSMILQDAGYLASAELYLAERRTGTTHQYAANGRGGSLGLPTDLFSSRVAFRSGGFGLEYRLSRTAGKHTIVVDLAAQGDEPAVTGVLELDATAASPDLAVGARLPRGSLYTTKTLFPVSGTLRVGDTEVVFDPARDVAILDEHKSELPYRTGWTWGTFAWHDAGAAGPAGRSDLVGANFAVRPSLPGQEEESGIWSPAGCEALADVRFEPTGAPGPGGPGALVARDDLDCPWRVTSGDGRLDTVFTPEGHKTVRLNFGVVAMDYVQLYGRYRGTLVAGGEKREVPDVPGVLEEMKARL